MNSRLLELREMGSSRGVKYRENEDNNSTASSILPEFQHKIQQVKTLIKQIEAYNITINEESSRYSKATTAISEKEINARISQVMKDGFAKNSQLKTLISSIEDDTKDSISLKPDDPETTIKKTNLNAINCKVREVLQDFQAAQLAFKQTVKDKIKREALLLDNTLSESDVENICSDPNQINVIRQKQFIQSATVQQLNTLDDIQEKHKDILELEKSVRQVDELFKDLAMLVHHQGMVIDDIESNIKVTKSQVTQSNQHLDSGKQLHKKAKKKMCILLMIGAIIAAVIVVPIVA